MPLNKTGELNACLYVAKARRVPPLRSSSWLRDQNTRDPEKEKLLASRRVKNGAPRSVASVMYCDILIYIIIYCAFDLGARWRILILYNVRASVYNVRIYVPVYYYQDPGPHYDLHDSAGIKSLWYRVWWNHHRTRFFREKRLFCGYFFPRCLFYIRTGAVQFLIKTRTRLDSMMARVYV